MYAKHPKITRQKKRSFEDSPLARQPLSAEGEARFTSLKREIMRTIYADRLSARELLGIPSEK